jgi:hypothetical protein
MWCKKTKKDAWNKPPQPLALSLIRRQSRRLGRLFHYAVTVSVDYWCSELNAITSTAASLACVPRDRAGTG